MTAGVSPSKQRASMKKSSPRKSALTKAMSSENTMVKTITATAGGKGKQNSRVAQEISQRVVLDPQPKEENKAAHNSSATGLSQSYNLGIMGSGAEIFRNESYEAKIKGL